MNPEENKNSGVFFVVGHVASFQFTEALIYILNDLICYCHCANLKFKFLSLAV